MRSVSNNSERFQLEVGELITSVRLRVGRFSPGGSIALPSARELVLGPAIQVRVRNVITDRVRRTSCEFCGCGKDDEGFIMRYSCNYEHMQRHRLGKAEVRARQG